MSDAQAVGQALTIAERLLDPQAIVAAAPERPGACLQSLAGTALLHARLAHADPRFERAAHAHWTAAVTRNPRPRTAAPGVFATPGGMAASLILAEGYLTDPEPQRHAVPQAVHWLSGQATAKAVTYHERLRRGPATPAWELYDAITGLAGIGRILLAALTNGHDQAEPGLKAALTTLTTIINAPGGRTRPGWWLPADGHSSITGVPPSGVAETGMAHGIAGPLALLSIASSAGWEVDGQIAAIRAAAQWLLTWQNSGTTTWPPYITGRELDDGPPALAPANGRRDAWCYGAPGIGRALTLAGHALPDPRLAEAGDTAIASLASRPAHLWDTEGPTLCHGSSGVLQCVAARKPATVDPAAASVTSAFNPEHLFAVQHLRAGTASDDPGLLTGAAGIALALADHGNLPAPAPATRWDAVLLLS